MSFDFEKFVEDIEKREEKFRENKIISEKDLFEQEAKRKRNELYQERWQNRIEWKR